MEFVYTFLMNTNIDQLKFRAPISIQIKLGTLHMIFHIFQFYYLVSITIFCNERILLPSFFDIIFPKNPKFRFSAYFPIRKK